MVDKLFNLSRAGNVLRLLPTHLLIRLRTRDSSTLTPELVWLNAHTKAAFSWGVLTDFHLPTTLNDPREAKPYFARIAERNQEIAALDPARLGLRGIVAIEQPRLVIGLSLLGERMPTMLVCTPALNGVAIEPTIAGEHCYDPWENPSAFFALLPRLPKPKGVEVCTSLPPAWGVPNFEYAKELLPLQTGASITLRSRTCTTSQLGIEVNTGRTVLRPDEPHYIEDPFVKPQFTTTAIKRVLEQTHCTPKAIVTYLDGPHKGPFELVLGDTPEAFWKIKEALARVPPT